MCMQCPDLSSLSTGLLAKGTLNKNEVEAEREALSWLRSTLEMVISSSDELVFCFSCQTVAAQSLLDLPGHDGGGDKAQLESVRRWFNLLSTVQKKELPLDMRRLLY